MNSLPTPYTLTDTWKRVLNTKSILSIISIIIIITDCNWSLYAELIDKVCTRRRGAHVSMAPTNTYSLHSSRVELMADLHTQC